MSSPIPVLLAWSGGKDSCLALERLRRSKRWRVEGLLTTVTEEYDRISMHGVRSSLLRSQADALGLPLTVVHVPPAASNATYEQRMAAVLAAARRRGVDTVAFGDLYLEEIRAYRERLLAEVGMRALFPLWGEPTARLAERFVRDGHRAVLTCVDTAQISGDFAGRDYDLDLLSELPASADPCGENGEFHTFVHAGPALSRPLPLLRGERILREDRFMYCDFAPAAETPPGTPVRGQPST